MTRAEPQKIWWTATEMAAAKLPEMPGSRQGVDVLAERLGWRTVEGGARRRAGRGGGWEYHWSVLPKAAQVKLLKDVETAAARGVEQRDRGTAWADFEAVPQSARNKAEARLRALRLVETLHQAGALHTVAVADAARSCGVSARSIYGWISMVEGIAPEDWLAYLVPRHSIGKRGPKGSGDTRPFMYFLKSHYLRKEAPAFASCWRIAVKKAKAEGWDTLVERTAYRRLLAEVPYLTRVLAREGSQALSRRFPAQIRDRSGLVAMEAVNADCHKFDVFVKWPDGTINRPQVIAFQDLYSNKILSWQVDYSPNTIMVMAAFREMIETWGIPKRCTFDNGHEFANKRMTGGVKSRFRFKIKDDEPLGALPSLGIHVSWAKPAHGQAKPIERAFGDWASNIAKDVRFHGAYVGNSPMAKPENYGSRAVPAETFLRVLDEGVREHNAREGRLSDTAKGRSFDQTFAESYERVPVRKASEEQIRMCLMGQEVCTLRQDNGQLRLFKNFYHSDWMSQRPGEKVIARFDARDLHGGLYIYDRNGIYLGFAECRQKVGFYDETAAKDTARRESRIKSAEKALVKAHAQLTPRELAEDLDRRAGPAQVTPEAKVVAPDFGRKPKLPMGRPKYERPDDRENERAREALILQMHKPAEAPAATEDTAAAKFWRVQEILGRSERGEAIGEAEAEEANRYTKTSDYQGQLAMFQTFGANGIK